MEFHSLLKEYKRQIDISLRDFLTNEKNKISNPSIQSIFDFIIDFCLRGGKRIRPILLIVSYESMGHKTNSEIIKASLSIELLEAFLLIHDDIIDRDDIRRGGPSFHKMVSNDEHFGLSSAIMAGDLLNSLATRVIMETNFEYKLPALKELINAQIDCFYGELYDVLLEKEPTAREEDIFNIIDLKTVSYTTRAPLVMGAILGGAPNSHIEKLYEYAKLLGRAFQIVDDILGTFGDAKTTGKPTDSDIKQGKKTLLVIWTFNNGDKKSINELKNYLNKNLTPKDLECVKKIFVNTGALDYLKNKAANYIKEANYMVNSMDITPESKYFLSNLGNFIIERNF